MPTPNERRALIFLAALGALGVGVRAFRGVATPGGAATGATRMALERQIGAVDSAASARRPSSHGGVRRKRENLDTATSGAAPARQRARGATVAGAGDAVPSATDPLARYEARRLEVARRNAATQARIDRDRYGADSGGAIAAPPTGRSADRATRTLPVANGIANRPRSDRLVDLDAAGVSEVESLPGVGPVLAARIVADRTARGPFGSLAGLQRVRGVGSGLAARLGPFVTFSGIAAGAQTTVKFRAVRVRPNRP